MTTDTKINKRFSGSPTKLRRRKSASKKARDLAKLDELFQRAWKETYESRKRRLS